MKHGHATELAEVLSRNFKNEATVSALPGGSTLLVTASGPLTAEIVKLLDLMDQKPRTVTVDVVLAEFKAGANVPELGGDVAAKLADLRKTGPVESWQEFRLTGVEGQPMTTVSGGSKPTLRGSTVTAIGSVQRSITYQTVGTTIKVTARGLSDGMVALDLDLKDTRFGQPAAIKETAPEPKGEKLEPKGEKPGPKGEKPEPKGEKEPRPRATPIVEAPPAIETTSLNTKLSVPAGRPVVAQTTRESGRATLLVIVTARADDAGAKPGE
ncbi:hypothetical protein FRUB_07706 [Fimbriiglobus ruber]|uniref:Uncharacterized protein n=1 Tax=Fimbriiglobus ruber TaxID=1908690 RepID=A0A225DM79_9BACT|nr:hypothetical protein FRUB_07706 [Fimbriiglobus ruber]